jgi:hypothetical protein
MINDRKIQTMDMMMQETKAVQSASTLTEQMAAHVDRLVTFHERQITAESNEEDVEMRERQIIRLQHEFSAVRSLLASGSGLN